MPTAKIVGDVIYAEVEIAAAPEKVFRALTDPEQLTEWWGAEGAYKTRDWKLELKPGARWRCNARNIETGVESHIEGEVLEVDPTKTLPYKWNQSWASVRGTIVRYE